MEEDVKSGADGGPELLELALEGHEVEGKAKKGKGKRGAAPRRSSVDQISGPTCERPDDDEVGAVSQADHLGADAAQDSTRSAGDRCPRAVPSVRQKSWENGEVDFPPMKKASFRRWTSLSGGKLEGDRERPRSLRRAVGEAEDGCEVVRRGRVASRRKRKRSPSGVPSRNGPAASTRCRRACRSCARERPSRR